MIMMIRRAIRWILKNFYPRILLFLRYWNLLSRRPNAWPPKDYSHPINHIPVWQEVNEWYKKDHLNLLERTICLYLLIVGLAFRLVVITSGLESIMKSMVRVQ